VAAQRLNKRQLKRELNAVRPYSRSQIADGQRHEAGLRHRITAGELKWLMPGLPLPWRTWVQQVLRPEAIAAQPALCSSFVLGMDIPLLQRFAAEVPESNRLYVHSLSDAQALVFGDAGHCVKATLQQGQISDWQTSPAEASEPETRLRAADATALHAAWQCFAQEMDCPSNLSQFRAQVFDAGLQSQRLVCISPITLDWMDHYANIHTDCRWFNGVSRILDGREIIHTIVHGRD